MFFFHLGFAQHLDYNIHVTVVKNMYIISVVAALLSPVSGLKCYDCDSSTSECPEPFNGTSVEEVECKGICTKSVTTIGDGHPNIG